MDKDFCKQIIEELRPKIEKIVYEQLSSDNTKQDKNAESVGRLINRLMSMSKSERMKAYRHIINPLNEGNVVDIKNDIINGKSVFGKINAQLYDNIPDEDITDREQIGIGIFYQDCDLFCLTTNKIFELYRIDNWQCDIIEIDNQLVMNVIIPNNHLYLNDFLNELKEKNFYFIIDKTLLSNFYKNNKIYLTDEYKDIYDDIVKNWYVIKIISKEQVDVRDIITKDNQYLYHYSFPENKESILKNGILCDNKAHPEFKKRVFVTIKSRFDLITPEQYVKLEYRALKSYTYYRNALLRSIQNRAIKNNSNKAYDTFIEFKIDLNKLPQNMTIHRDIKSYPYALYINENIPANAIVGTSIIKID